MLNNLSIWLKNNFLASLCLAIFFIILIGLSIGIYARENQSEAANNVIIIDAGHGGLDPGKVSDNGINEKDLNLSIAMKLVSKLESEGFKVVVTRSSDASLADAGAKNEKRSDMNNRMNIINNSNAALLISIHQNSFPDAKVKGAQVFYHEGSAEGKAISGCIQKRLISEVDSSNKRVAKPGDSYYILKKSSCTSIIVECGFLSCPEESVLLCDEAYQDKIVNAICNGVLDYYGMKDKKTENTDEKNTTIQ